MIQYMKDKKARREHEMIRLIELGASLFYEAAMFEACAAFSGDAELKRRAEVARSRYEGARTLLSMRFGITEEQVDDDMEQLALDAVAPEGEPVGR